MQMAEVVVVLSIPDTAPVRGIITGADGFKIYVQQPNFMPRNIPWTDIISVTRVG